MFERLNVLSKRGVMSDAAVCKDDHCHCHGHDHDHGHDHVHDDGHCHCHDEGGGWEVTLRLIVVTACIYVAGLVASFVNPLGIMDITWVKYVVFLVPYLMVGLPVLIGAAKGIARRELLDEQFLMAVATIAAFAIGEAAEAVAVMLFYQVGEWFQDRAVDNSRKSISSLVEIKATYANVEEAGAIKRVDPEDVKVGDIIVVIAGERVPLDGIIVKGASELDTSALTGESMPSFLEPGQEVLSGFVNGTNTLHVRVTRLFEDSAVSRVLDMVTNAASKKAKTEAFVRRFARVYTPIVVGAALLLAVIPPLVLGPANPAVWADFIERACVFLVISCPCALVISVPLSFYCGIGSLSRRGVLAKGGNYLEQLARVETVVFDKTGTLTQGKFHVEAIAPVEGVTPERLLGLAAHVEQRSTHPIAQSICDAYAERLGIPPTLNLPEHSDEVAETPGHGLCAECVEGHICVGNDKLMDREGIVWTSSDQPGTVIHVALDGTYLGYLVVSDEIKPQAREAIEELKALGVRDTVMLTGDKEPVAQRIASKLGIDRFFAQLLPGDKVAKVEELLVQKGAGSKETLAFVGDGINDAPALARADVGIAMGAMGSDAAIEAADIVLMDDNPARIADAVKFSRKTVVNARENVVFAIAVKFAVFVLGALGIANMWMAVFADTGVAMLCVLNAMRLLRAPFVISSEAAGLSCHFDRRRVAP